MTTIVLHNLFTKNDFSNNKETKRIKSFPDAFYSYKRKFDKKNYSKKTNTLFIENLSIIYYKEFYNFFSVLPGFIDIKYVKDQRNLCFIIFDTIQDAEDAMNLFKKSYNDLYYITYSKELTRNKKKSVSL
jgi:hypothetical protein